MLNTTEERYVGGTYTPKEPLYLLPADMRLGDVIECFEGAFSTGIVEGIEPAGWVKIYRPYGRSDDFSYGGDGIQGGPKVIVMMGAEHYCLFTSDKRAKYRVWSRKEIK